MNMVKGFRFHPTDEELIEYLQIKTFNRETFNRDSLVQVIAEIPDICESEPWELPGRSVLQTGDRLWYFMYPPKYKYQNSKLVSRTTSEGYWKITGKARKIINSETGMEIGNKKTLLFYKGQCNDKIKKNTSWVMHEYELKAMLDPTNSHQKTFKLCKLKKKTNISSKEGGQLDRCSLSNLENHVANNALLEDILDPNGSSEPEASNNHDDVHNHCSTVDTYGDERSNQHNILDEDEGSNLSSNLINHVAEDAIPKVPSHIFKVYQNGLEDNNWVQDLYSTIEREDEYCNSIITSYDVHNHCSTVDTYGDERSNQHNILDEDEGSNLSSNLINHVAEDAIPKVPSHIFKVYQNGLEDNNWVQDLYSTIEREDEYCNSIITSYDVHNHCSTVDTYGDERSNQHNILDEDEGSNLSSNLINHVAEDAIPKVPSHIFKVYQNGLEDNNWVQDLYSTIEREDEYCNSIITSYDDTITNERSNQHNIVVAEKGIETPIISYDEIVTNERSNQHNIVDVDEGFEMSSNLKYLVEEDTILTELLYNDKLYSRSLFGELLAEPEATNNSNWIQNQYITKKEDDEFLNSTLPDGNTQWCLAADGEGFSLPCMGARMESSNSMEKPSKRPRRM